MCFQAGRSWEARISGILIITDQKTDALISLKMYSFKVSDRAHAVKVLPQEPEDPSLTLETNIMV